MVILYYKRHIGHLTNGAGTREDGLTMYRWSFVSPFPRRHCQVSTSTPDRRRSSARARGRPRRPASVGTPAVWASVTSSPISGRGWLDTCSHCWLENPNKLWDGRMLACSNAPYIIIYDEMKSPDVREANILRSYSCSQGWTSGSAGRKSQPKLLRSESVQSRLGLWWKLLQPGDRKQGSLNHLTPLLKVKGWPVFYSILAFWTTAKILQMN